ncbi:MAG: hypothetical protein ABI422_04315 [Sphingomicrobium sp.]
MIEIGRKTMRGSDGNDYVVRILEEQIAFRGLKKTSSVGGMHYHFLEDGREVILLDNRDTISGTNVYSALIDASFPRRDHLGRYLNLIG